MPQQRPILWLYLKTGIATALVAAIVTLRVAPMWGMIFALGGLVGLVNWAALGLLLVSLLRRRPLVVLQCLVVKTLALGVTFFVLLPQVAPHVGAFLCGFSMFLLMSVVEAGGMAVHAALVARSGGDRPLPRDWRALILGTSRNG